MYSDQIQQLLEEKDIETGDRVKADNHEGVLMPKPSSGNPKVLVLKLDSGYNIGVQPEKLELIEKTQQEETAGEEVQHSDDKPDILVLHTGGTIASRVSYEEGGVKPAFDPEDLVEMYPELAEEVNVHSKVVAQMLSEDMEPDHWQEIAEEIDDNRDYDGIILGHGTDTMQYTGAALTLMLQNLDTGVMIVGSQRSSDRPSSDAAMNMYCAAHFLTETDFTGVGICMHSSTNDTECNILNPAKVRKMHTSRRDAFEPINTEPLATVNYETGEVEYEEDDKRTGEYIKKTEIDTEVGVLKTRPGMKPVELQNLIDRDLDGVVVEGTGLGHMPVNAFDEKTQHHAEILEKLEELAEDTVVVMSSQCLNGRVDMNVYDAGLKIQDAGVYSSEDMHPELAYVKLMWSLGQADDREEAVQLFQENINGELTERTPYIE